MAARPGARPFPAWLVAVTWAAVYLIVGLWLALLAHLADRLLGWLAHLA